MANIYYHNTSKCELNLDLEDMLSSYEEGDTVLRTERGNALTEIVEQAEILKLKSSEEE